MAKLHLLAGNNVVATVELTGDLVTIGRTEDKNLCIEDDSISENHGVLVRAGDEYQIHDFNSSNGTWVNGERILAVKLKHGDRIRIGSVDVLYDSAIAPPVPKIKLGEGAKRVEHTPAILPVPLATTPAPAAPPPAPAPAPAPPPSPAPAPAVEPPKPVRRTLGGKTLGASSEPSAPPAPAKKASQPVPVKKAKEDRVFINIPDTPAAPPPPPSRPTFAAPPPPPPVPEPEPEPIPEPVVEPAPAPVTGELEEYQVVLPSDDLSHLEPQAESAKETQVAQPPPAVEMSLESGSAAEPVEKKLQVGAAGNKGEVKLRQTPPPGGGERKLAMKPTVQAPRDQLRFGPAKKP
jgi:predicted component of type VI protein secretion system